MLLDITVIVALVLAVTCAVYGLLAFFKEPAAEKEVKDAAKEVSKAAKTAAQTATGGEGGGLAEGVTPQAAFSGAAEYLKALASFAEALSKLKRDVAALVL